MLRENEGPDALVDAGPLLRHVHIAEKDRRTPPGVAGDDFRPYLRALRRAGYAGDISIECRWDDLAASCGGLKGSGTRSPGLTRPPQRNSLLHDGSPS